MSGWKQRRLALGMCRRCLKNPPADGSACCLACIEYASLRQSGSFINYKPLDEILREPSVQLLRALRHHDWVSVSDLFDDLSVPEFCNGTDAASSDSNRQRNAFAKAIGRLCERGCVERQRLNTTRWFRDCDNLNQYRITDAGRAELARKLTVDMECMWADEPERKTA